MYENNFTTIIEADIQTLYTLLKDLDSYSQIIPYIKSIKYEQDIYRSASCPAQPSVATRDRIIKSNPIKAHVVLEHWMIKLEYDCDIYFDDSNFSIRIDGYGHSFEQINGYWTFKKLSEDLTEVSYKLKFKMKNPIKQKIAEKVFCLYENKMQEKIKKYLLKFKNRLL